MAACSPYSTPLSRGGGGAYLCEICYYTRSHRNEKDPPVPRQVRSTDAVVAFDLCHVCGT